MQSPKLDPKFEDQFPRWNPPIWTLARDVFLQFTVMKSENQIVIARGPIGNESRDTFSTLIH